MNPKFFSRVLLALLLCAPLAQAKGPRACEGYPSTRSFPTPEFFNTHIPAVRTLLRSNRHVNDRLIACLQNDTEWLRKQAPEASDPRAAAKCDIRIENLRNTVAQNFSRMRQLLALTDIGGTYGAARSARNPTRFHELYKFAEALKKAPQNNSAWERDAANNYMMVNVSHPFWGLAELKPLSNAEILAVYADLDRVETNAYNFLTTDIGRAQPTQGLMNQVYDVVEAYRQQARKEYESIVTNDPIMTFVSSENPSNEDFVNAVKKMSEHIGPTLARIEDAYYVPISEDEKEFKPLTQFRLNANHATYDELALFTKSIELATDSDPSLCDGLDAWASEIQNRQTVINLGILAVIAGGSIACEVSKVGWWAKAGCRSLFGIGGNGVFLGVSQNEYNKVLDLMFTTPYGYGALTEIDRLSDAQFANAMSWIFLPVGSGLTPVIKKMSGPTVKWLQSLPSQLAR